MNAGSPGLTDSEDEQRSSEPDGTDRSRPSSTPFIVAFAVVSVAIVAIVAAYGRNRLFIGDFWEHAAVVRELAMRPLHPRNPLLDLAAPHAFFSPYSLFLGLVARGLGTTAISTLSAAAVVNLVLWLLSVIVFLRRACPDRAWATAAFALPLWLFAWGKGAWIWSGFLHFNALVRVCAYPSTFAIALVFFALAAAWDAHERPLLLVPAGGCATLAWLVHPTTAVVLTVGVAVVVAARTALDARALARNAALVAAMAVGAVALACLWPYYPLFDLLTSPRMGEFDQASLVFFQGVGSRIWPLAVLAPIALWRLKADWRDPFVALALASGGVYVAGAFGRAGLGRAIAWVAMFTQLAAARSLADAAMRAGRRERRIIAAAVVAFAALMAGVFHGRALRRAWPRADIRFVPDIVAGVVGADDVVMAPLTLGLRLPSTAGRIVASPHPLYWVPDHDERRRDVRRFFEPGTSYGERCRILERWHARYIVVDTRREPLDQLAVPGREVRRDGPLHLLRVDPRLVP